ncbi:putative epoxide hydrolase [Fusarium oxysporum f. sp. albedinis]|nr:putative epoxide hydrolase [Fusarium oxysporum f. sp. albedinis]
MANNDEYQNIPGLTRLSSQIFLQGGEKRVGQTVLPEHPRVVIIYGWGDGLLKHIVKYLYEFRQLYPHAKQVIVLSPMAQAMRQNAAQRSNSMLPVIEAAFPRGIKEDSADSVLIHVMSSTGVINYAATLDAYRQIHGVPLPHCMASYDSTAGNSDFNLRVLFQWSYALALGTRSWNPLPFFMAQFAWGVFICVNHLLDIIKGRESAGTISKRIMLDEKFKSKKALNVYIYSMEDKLVSWMDIEKGIAEAKGVGYRVECAVFEGSEHVSHMKVHPELYWKTIERAWERSQQE